MEDSPPAERAVILMKQFLKITAVCLAAGLLLMAPARTAVAQSTSSCQRVVDYIDLDADGQPEAMVLACQFAPGTDDGLTIYKQSGKVDTDIPWQQNIAYENETWLFDHGIQGRASLIVNFRRDGTSLVAELYDDRNQDGEVGYEIDSGTVEITESQYWTAQVVAPDGWWVQNGVPNYNLHIEVDGDVEGMFSMQVYRSYLATDGQSDYDIQIYDQNHNGKPELDKRMIRTPFLRGSVGLGTQVMVNWADDELPISGGFTLWPYLDLVHEWQGGSTRVVKGYETSPAPILFEPATGRIEAVAEFVASRGGEHNCFYYSAIPWLPGQVNESDNENPFCFYDLAGDGDRVPELQIRSVYWPPNDRAFLQGAVSEPYGLIRYSWDQENSQSWRYAIGLVGRHAMEHTVTFADIDVLTVPYSELPGWVMDQSWDMAVFSEFTGSAYFTSEGNYSVSYPESWSFARYFTGMTSLAPSPEYEPEAHFRMEWAMDYGSRPYLYFSPVDHRLHLLGATGGAWNVDGTVGIQYVDHSGNGYLDQWQVLEADAVQEQLNALPDYLVYAGDGMTVLKRASVPYASFQTTPPTNQEEWLVLGEQLERYRLDLTSADLISMVEQFDGPTTQIQGTKLRDLQQTPQGFRFILEVQPGFSMTSDPEGWGARLIAPGPYAVSFDGTVWYVQQASPAMLQAGELNVGTPGQPLRALDWTSLEVSLENDGLEDAHDLPVYALLTGPMGEQEVLTATMALLPAEGSQQVAWDWTPPVAGAWQMRIEAGGGPGVGSALSRQLLLTADLPVQPQTLPSAEWLLSLGGLIPPAIVALLPVISLLAVGAWVLWAAGRWSRGGQ